MGLKTTNYTVKSTDYTYPNAYAMLNNLVIESGWVKATFVVQETREKAINKDPLEIIHLGFKWDRKANPVEMAYNLVKSKITDYEYNEEKGVHESYEREMPLFGWQDDYYESIV